jgi:AraC-like DNA-binding protein
MGTAVIDLSATKPVLPKFPSYGIAILESRHVPGFEMPQTSYEFCEVMLILDGKGNIATGKRRLPVQKGTVIAVPYGTPYFYEDSVEAPLGMLCLCIRPQARLVDFFAPVIPQHFAVIRSGMFSREVAGHLRRILHEQSNAIAASSALVVGETLLLLSKLQRHQKVRQVTGNHALRDGEKDMLVHVRDYAEKLKHSFYENETLDAAAAKLGMSPRSLSHYFRKATGLSRTKYIQGLRVQHAECLLRETDQSITSIAFACGFEDISNFFRTFRLAHAASPAQWRERSRRRRPGSGNGNLD